MPKKDTHPQYHQAKVTCACGASFTIGATRKEIQVEICSSCHPFYTGEQKLIDTAGRLEKFEARRKKASDAPSKKKRTRKSGNVAKAVPLKKTTATRVKAASGK